MKFNEVENKLMLHEVMNMRLREGLKAGREVVLDGSVRDPEGRGCLYDQTTGLFVAPIFTLDPNGLRAQCVGCGAFASAELGLHRCGRCYEYVCAEGDCKLEHTHCSRAGELKLHGLRKAGLMP